MIYHSIWQDTIYETTASTLDYRIELDGSTIFTGRAVRLPNQTKISINIAKVCANYIHQDLEAIIDESIISQTNPYAYRVFTLKNKAGVTLQTYGFLCSWDYPNVWNGGTVANLTPPVNGEKAAGMWCLKSSYSNGAVTTTISGDSYYPKTVCADWALYYVGRGGGWASFAYTGKMKKTDAIDYHQYDHSYRNFTEFEYERGRYAAEIIPTYELTTGILTEEQAERYAKDLISSNQAYLHNLKTLELIPVVLAESSAEYKTEDGEDVITYTTKVKGSRTILRQ